MKKKVLCIVLILLLVLMLIPAHVYMTDGGSKGWYAILWQYTDCFEIAEKDGQFGYTVGPRVTILPFGLITVFDDTHFVPADAWSD